VIIGKANDDDDDDDDELLILPFGDDQCLSEEQR
jgi:hypothetical protein